MSPLDKARLFGRRMAKVFVTCSSAIERLDRREREMAVRMLAIFFDVAVTKPEVFNRPAKRGRR